MKVIVGIDLGSTTTKAILLDEAGRIVGRGITNSRSNYHVACAVAREEALTAARFSMLQRAIDGHVGPVGDEIRARSEQLIAAFRLELYRRELVVLNAHILELIEG